MDGKQIVKVAAGNVHSLAKNAFGTIVYAWGRSDYGQLGLHYEKIEGGDFESTPKEVAFPATIGDDLIKDIAAGPLTSYATTTSNDVYSWGFNESCATGIRSPDLEDVLRPQKVNVLAKYSKDQNCHVHNISGGGQHTLMVVKRYA